MTDQVADADYDTAGCPETDRGNWMQLGGGRIFYPLDPRPEEVFIEDIAKSLSRMMRYNGHSDQPISVAQHSVQTRALGARDGRPITWLFALLLHDAPEAFIGDMIRPLKMNMPGFRDAEKKVEHAVKVALDIPYCPPEVIKHYDNLAFAWEKRDLFKSAREWPGTPEVPEELHVMKPWSMTHSEDIFLTEYWLLMAKMKKAEQEEDDFWEPYTDTRDWRSV